VEKQSLEVLDCMDNLAAQLSIPTTSLISHLGLASLFLTPDFSTEVHSRVLQHLFTKSHLLSSDNWLHTGSFGCCY